MKKQENSFVFSARIFIELYLRRTLQRFVHYSAIQIEYRIFHIKNATLFNVAPIKT